MKIVDVVENEAAGRGRSVNENRWILKIPNTTYGRQAIAEMRQLVKNHGRLRLRGRGPRKIYEGLTSNPYLELPLKYSRYFTVYFYPNFHEKKNPYRKERKAIDAIMSKMGSRGFYLATYSESPTSMQLLDKA